MGTLVAALPAAVADEHDVRALEIGEALAITADVPAIELNRVLGVVDPLTDPELHQLDEHFGGRRYAIQVAPGAEALEPRLAERGFERGDGWMKFERDAAPAELPATELRVEEVDAARSSEFAEALAQGYGLPPWVGEWFTGLLGAPGWHCFLGYADEEPAAAGALFVTGRTGWLGAAATKEAHRGQGGQGAILAARIARAAELGCDVVTTETGAQGGASYRNILRAGFREAYVRPNWVRPD